MLLSIAKIGARNCTYQISIKSLLVKLTRLHCQVRVQPQPYPRNPKSRHCDNMSFDTFLCVIQRQLTKHPSCYYHTSRQDSRQQSLHLISHTRYRRRHPSTRIRVVPFKVTNELKRQIALPNGTPDLLWVLSTYLQMVFKCKLPGFGLGLERRGVRQWWGECDFLQVVFHIVLDISPCHPDLHLSF